MVLTRSDYEAIKNKAIKNKARHIQIGKSRFTLEFLLDLETAIGVDKVYEEIKIIIDEENNK